MLSQYTRVEDLELTDRLTVSLKLKLSVLGRTAWRPFDVEFDSVKSRLLTHRNLFEFEARSAVDFEALKFFEKFDKDLEQSVYGHDLRNREGETDFARNEEEEKNKLLSGSILTR